MEHGRFSYSPISKRPQLPLPNGARVAVWITPNIEHFHYDKPAISLTPMTAALKPDGVRIAQFNEAPAGQSVFHLHFHVIPIYEGVPLRGHGSDGRADDAELAQLAKAISGAL